MKRLLLAMLFAAFTMPVLSANAASEHEIDDGHGRLEFREDFGSNLGLSGLPMVECEFKRTKPAASHASEREQARHVVRGS